jgi:Holliday junction resolvase RusA-like endonuclease
MHTDLDNIEKLLEKYLEATTNLQEEALLKDYFTSDNVAPHLQEYTMMFQYFKQSKSERFTKSIRLETNKQKRKWIGIAASIAILISVFTLNRYQENKKTDKAYADTQNALKMIATHMNKGTIAIGQLNKFEQTTRKVFKQNK